MNPFVKNVGFASRRRLADGEVRRGGHQRARLPLPGRQEAIKARSRSRRLRKHSLRASQDLPALLLGRAARQARRQAGGLLPELGLDHRRRHLGQAERSRRDGN